LKRILVVALILLSLSIPTGVRALAPSQTIRLQNKALLLSSLNATIPMGKDASLLISYLNQAGYSVTYLADTAVTVNYVVNGLNNYSLVIWRTNTYMIEHTLYWYVGDVADSGVRQAYASDFSAGRLNSDAGIVGMTPNFIKAHFGPGSLSHVKLLMFIASFGNSIAPQFLAAGASTVVFGSGIITLQGGLIDDLTVHLVSYLTDGQNVQTAVYNTLTPYDQGQQPSDNLDSTYAPPFWFIGNGALTIP
jgi:hypothetical protein